MKIVKLRIAIGVFAVLALTLTALASAHPSLYNIVGTVAKPPEIQTITVDATGGVWKPSAGALTVPYDAPSWQVQNALAADAAIGRNATTGQANVLVTKAGSVYTLRFQGSLATAVVPQVVPDPTGLTGGAQTAVANTTSEGGGADIRYEDDTTGATLPDDVLRTAIANDGHAMTFVESNGLATNGWLNLRFMPGGYRRPAAPGIPMTEEQWVTWPMAQTTIQSHATCQGVAALNTLANVLAVQSNENDPFWNYVPFQGQAAGLGDEASQWIPVVQTATGVDLTGQTTAAQLRPLCEGIGGVFVPADTPSNPASAAISEAVAAAIAPLNAMIADLEDQVEELTTGRPLSIVPASRANAGKVIAMVGGPLSQPVTIRLRIGSALANQLNINRVLDTVTTGFGTRGAVLVTLAPGSQAANRLRNRGAVAAEIHVTSGAAVKTAAVTINP